MRTPLLAVALLAVAPACRSHPASAPPTAIANTGGTPAATTAITGADDAIDHFITAWDTEVRPTIPGHKDPLIGQIDASMHEAGARVRYSATLGPCRDESKGIEELIQDAHYNFVLHGSLDVAHAHPQCWAVKYVCCMKGDAEGMLDPDTGELLVVWRIPEG